MKTQFKLYDYQKKTVEFGLKNKYCILGLDCGLGKTLTSLVIASESGCKKTLIICPGYLRLKWQDEINKFFPGKSITIVKSSKEMEKLVLFDLDFIIMSYGLIEKSDRLFEWSNMVIADECFHEDTLIETIGGEKKIKNIVTGDYVKSAIGYSKVLKVTKTFPKESLKVVYNNREIICSLNHPFFTDKGWVKASNLEIGDSLVTSNSAMRILSNSIKKDSEEILRKFLFDEVEEKYKGILRKEIFRRNKRKSIFKINWEVFNDLRTKIKTFFKNERKKPNEIRRSSVKEFGEIEENGLETSQERGKWTWPNSTGIRNNEKDTRIKMEYSNPHKNKAWFWIPLLLQIRSWISRIKNTNRDRWAKSFFSKSERIGQEKRGFCEKFRVESVEILQQTSFGEFGSGCFYDLTIEGHPSFTVNEALVHNCHALKEMKTKRTEAFHRLIYENSVDRCLLLTGTPVQNRVYEFYSLMAICNYNPQIEESSFLSRFSSYVSFANHFSYLKEFDMMRAGKRIKIQQWEGIRKERLPELFSYLKSIYISFKSEEVLDLPPYIDIEVPMEMTDMPELLSEFDAFMADDKNKNSAEIRAKANAAKLKAPFTVEYVQDLLDSGKQVVVYTDHVESCQEIANGLSCPAITGTTPTNMRDRIAKEFMDKERMVLVATIGSFSTGIDLYSSFNMVINDMNWVPGNMKQAKYRIRRIGQMNKCFFHYIIGTPQDKIIKKKLDAKMAVIREIF